MGRHQRQCKICGVKMSERFYSDDTLYRGIEDRGDDVRKMQEALIEQGYLKGKADGKFGMQTQQAVRNFQRDHGFYQDGTAWEPVLDELYGTEKVHLEITDVVPPFANCTGETTASVANEGYQVTGVAWLYNGAAMSADETFTEGETYTVMVSLLAAEPEGKEYTA
ncbi:MAG: peptidoglycan-binding protein, partial [Clostridia bacterium]|nr:peptidoglycan-binding protein [Clostridia bacterium]